MAVHYEVEEGKSLVIDGPANVIVKTGGVPIVGTGARAGEEDEGAETARRRTSRAQKSKEDKEDGEEDK